jgi:prolyl oligopeptidase
MKYIKNYSTRLLFIFNIAFIASLVIFPSCSPPGIPKPSTNNKKNESSKNRDNKILKKKIKRCIAKGARRQSISEKIHGVDIKDPYRWLENSDSYETRQWLETQNRCAHKYLDQMPYRKQINKRLKEISHVLKLSAPVRKGDRYFYNKRGANQEKTVFYWKEGKNGQEKTLLDPNTMSEDGSISVKGVFISRDGRYAAYKLSKNNADSAKLYIMEVDTSKTYENETIKGAKYARPSWDKQSKGFYYTRLPVNPKIPVSQLPGHAQVYYHKLGQVPAKDKIIYKKTGDPRKFLNAQVSDDGRYLFLYIHFGWSNTDLYFKDLKRRSKWKILAKDTASTYQATAWKNKIYLLTNFEAPNYRIFKIKPWKHTKKVWKEIVPEKEHEVLESFNIIGNKLALNYLHKASSLLKIVDLNGKTVRKITFTSMGSSKGLKGHPEHKEAYFSFSSFLQPVVIYETSVDSDQTKLYFKSNVPFDPSPYRQKQIHYLSKDGAKISMFIISLKNQKNNGKNPYILYGYGGFNISLTPRFSPYRAVWLEMGGSFAIPNLRGGGEYGEKWHKAGMLANKQNVFDDFIAAAEYLINNKYTSPRHLAIRGGSNGGLLVGAAMVQRPDLFKVVSCHVPLLDMLRYHLFGSGRTWISEYGTAEKKQQFNTLRAYSPYHHIKNNIEYPALLMMTADSDDRVEPMHARKFAAAIRHANKGNAPILFFVTNFFPQSKKLKINPENSY